MKWSSLVVIICFQALLRYLVSLHPYSGKGKPPMFGDFEAQRHWMEITTNLPVSDWYRESHENNLNYWGLDYPPLTAYHSYLVGLIGKRLDSTWFALHHSRGLESKSLKLFMRASVLVSDVLMYVPAVIMVYRYFYGSQLKTNDFFLKVTCALAQPSLLLIDHGHFQYNHIMLGLTTWAVFAIHQKRYLIASILFCLALSFKQMALFYAPAFFFFLLGKALKSSLSSSSNSSSSTISSSDNNDTTNASRTSDVNGKKSIISVLKQVISLAVSVIVSFSLVFFPYIFNPSALTQVLARIFPFQRGLYEDKVANVWCTLSSFGLKLRGWVDQGSLVKLSAILTAMAFLPSCLTILLRPNTHRFLYVLAITSLSFFLFGFQVHEKSILLPCLPITLLYPVDPVFCHWFLSISMYSLFPLALKDELGTAFFALLVLWRLALDPNVSDRSRSKQRWSLVYRLTDSIFLALFIMQGLAAPPPRFPDLYPVLNGIFSCFGFIYAWLYLNFEIS